VRDEREQARSEAHELGLPVREQRGRRDDQARGGGLARGLLATQQQERDDLDRLAEPHVVREACAEPEPAEVHEPSRSRLLVRTQRRSQLAAERLRAEPLRVAQRFERVAQPRAGVHVGPVGCRVGGADVAGGLDRRAGQQAHALREREPARAGLPLDQLPVRERLLEARAVDLDPLAAQPHEPSGPASRRSASSRVSSCSPSARPISKSTIASSPSPAGALVPRRTWTRGRGGVRARHQSGTSTTTPAASQSGTERRKR
jgi:hypothetical protein